MGWHWAKEIAKYFDTWVICEKHECRNDIINFFSMNGKIQGLHFCFVPKSKLEYRLQRLPGFYYLGYNLWHRRAYLMAESLNKEIHFDIAHQVNLSGFREPGYLWKLGPAFIWGPVGGTQNYPLRFLSKAGFSAAVIEGLRGILNVLQLRYSPRVRKATKRAAALLVANSNGKKDFERAHNVDTVLMLETAVSEVIDGMQLTGNHQGPLKIIWSGFFQRRKALHLLILALSKLPDSVRYELRILGRGPLEKRWRRLALQTGVEINCKWMGWLSKEKAIEQFFWADVLVFSSLRDTTGNVVLEALSRGVPVICFDHQGVGDIITENCGIKIPVTSADKAILKMSEAIRYLASERSKLQLLSRGAIERANNYLWSLNGEKMAKIYDEVIRV